jgi:hypothetical protein
VLQQAQKDDDTVGLSSGVGSSGISRRPAPRMASGRLRTSATGMHGVWLPTQTWTESNRPAFAPESNGQMAAERMGRERWSSTAALRVQGALDAGPPDASKPHTRRLPLERVIAVSIWVLVVLNVQPWTKQAAGPQGEAAVEPNMSKGALLAAVFAAHRGAYLLLVLALVVGLAAVPSAAWDEGSFSSGGRLQGVFLPTHPTGVGETGAILAGLTITALAFHRMGPVPAGILTSLGLLLIILSRTRTAAVALLIALFAAFSLTRRSRRGRRALLTIVLLVLVTVPLATPIQSWLRRDQDTQQLSTFTGRTAAWAAVMEQQSSWRTLTLGHGLGNKAVLLRRGEGDIDVMAIDNGWLSLLWETGILGVALVLLALVATIVAVCRAPTPYVRAAAGFLASYVVLSSFTESGLSDLSPHTLHILVAAGAAYADRIPVRGERLMLRALETARAGSTAVHRA